jgi:uncharacterized SAM-binding protein YcdF (DUF218 family)
LPEGMLRLSFSFVMPPSIFIALCLLAALAALRWHRLGAVLMLVGSFCLYLSATPFVAAALFHALETQVPEHADLTGAEAIVVLSAGAHAGNGQDILDTLDGLTLERMEAAARLYRDLKLPVAVTGGRLPRIHATLGSLMKKAMEEDFEVPVRWNEEQSHTTFENAVFTARLLKADHISTVIVVTHAWHLPRALWSFNHEGLRALPWPVGRTAIPPTRISDFLPGTKSLQDTFYALHELIGLEYYRLRF